MALELRQQLKLSQQLVMTPQLQMAIKLLQLSRLELMDTITQEMEENPVLEESLDSGPEDAELEAPEPLPAEPEEVKEVQVEENLKPEHDVDWENYFDDYGTTGKTTYEAESRELPSFETFVAKKESLEDHLLWQLSMAALTDEEIQIGSLIVGNLDKKGYLESTVEEIAVMAEVELEAVELLLEYMQTFDPMGVCARDLKECLMIQVERLGLDDSIVSGVIENHLTNLENKNYKAICKDLKITMKDVKATVEVIKGLEPMPGRLFTDEEPKYITPDIYVYKIDDEFVIVQNDDGLPKLKVNSYYKSAVSKGNDMPTQTKEYMQEKLRSATWLIKSIHQRQKTIYRVMESIVKFQKDFFEKGIAYLQPMVLRDVALDIEMHESTISRVTTNKYAFTPQGIFELKYFFNSSINRIHGGAIASASVMEKIKRIIESENPKKPYSDLKISEMLEESNIDIARRTVAKYREMMGYLSSNKRKQL